MGNGIYILIRYCKHYTKFGNYLVSNSLKDLYQSNNIRGKICPSELEKVASMPPK